MDMNFITFLLIVLLLVYMMYSRIKLYLDNQKELEKLSRKQNFQVYKSGSWLYVLYIVVMIASAAGFFYVYTNKIADATTWYLVFAVLFVSSVTDIIRCYIVNTTYYNDEGFFNNQKYVRYKSVRNFKPKRIPITTDVILYSGERITMPTKALQFLEDRMVKAQKA